MKPYINIIKTIMFLLLIIMFNSTLSTAQDPGGPIPFEEPPKKIDEPPRKPASSDQFVTIDFNNVDINVFIKFISELTGRNFIVDQRVKGKVTIISPKKISIKEAYKVFESVLDVHGFSTVKAGEITKILPSQDARTKNIETRITSRTASPEDRLVTQIIPMKYANPNEIKRLFTPMISKGSVIVAYPPTNTMIVTDTLSNIQRLLRILKEIDISGIGQEISVVPLDYADSKKIVTILSSVFQARSKTQKGSLGKIIKFVSDERTNTVVVLASQDDTSRIRSLIGMLDRETPRGKEKIQVYYLENATAEDLAKVLQTLPSKQTGTVKGKSTVPIISSKVSITADKATNSLIIQAGSDDYLVIEEIIKKLDIPRSMVYIEALIMEVNTNKDFRLGTEWSGADDTTIKGKNTAVTGGFKNESDASTLASVVGFGLPSGASLGIFTEAIKIAGVTFNNIRGIIQAYKKDKDVNILSTPQILTTDNEEAKIYIGKNLPFQTKISTSDNNTESFESYEYRDVGSTLKITPHISKDRMVRLAISLEVTDLESTTEFKPTTLKRTVDTTVIVNDKNTIVIGGLIDESYSITEYKVPVLGNIPIIGWLFKNRGKAREKTNLFIFLTPHVIENPAEAEEIYNKKKEHINKIEEGKIKLFKEEKEE